MIKYWGAGVVEDGGNLIYSLKKDKKNLPVLLSRSLQTIRHAWTEASLGPEERRQSRQTAGFQLELQARTQEKRIWGQKRNLVLQVLVCLACP